MLARASDSSHELPDWLFAWQRERPVVRQYTSSKGSFVYMFIGGQLDSKLDSPCTIGTHLLRCIPPLGIPTSAGYTNRQMESSARGGRSRKETRPRCCGEDEEDVVAEESRCKHRGGAR